MGSAVKRVFRMIADAITGGVVSFVQAAIAVVRGRISDALHYAMRSVMYATFNVGGILVDVLTDSLFESRYKDITNVMSQNNNLLGEQEPNDARQEFIFRAVVYEYSYAESMTQQLFYGGAIKFMRYIRWCNKEDIYSKLGYTVSTGISFTETTETNAVETTDFAPILCLRAWTIPTFEENFPEYYPILYKAAKKAFSDKKALKKLTEDIHKSESANDIDFAYVFWGTPLNRKERGPLRYIWEFFDWLVEKDPEIKATEYNNTFNGTDTQYYMDNNLYAEYAGKIYVKIATAYSRKGITFLATEEGSGNLLKVPFQWRLSWATIAKEMNLDGTVEGKGKIEITCAAKEEETEIENPVTAPIAVGAIAYKYYSSATDGDNQVTESQTRYKYVYLIHREKWYVGGFQLGGEEIEISFLEDKPQYVTGWGVPSDETITKAIQDGVISGDPKADYLKKHSGFNPIHSEDWDYDINVPSGSEINLYTITSLGGSKEVWVGTSGDTDQYESVPCYATIPSWSDSGPKIFVSPEHIAQMSGYHSGPSVINPITGQYLFSGEPWTIEVQSDGIVNIYGYGETYYKAILLDTLGTVSFTETIKIPPSNVIIIKKQQKGSTSKYDRITIHGLYVTNYCLSQFPVTSDAADCVDWEDNDEHGTCPLLIPFHYQVFRKLNALDRNEALQVMGNIIFNCFQTQTVEIKWYERKWFSVFMTICQIIGTIVLSYYMGPIGTYVGAFISGVVDVLVDALIQLIVKLIIGLIVKYVVTKIVTKITGNELIGELVGAVVGMIAASAVSYGGGGITVNFNFSTDFSFNNIASAALKIATEGYQKSQQLKMNNLQEEANALNDEMNQFKQQMDELKESNKEVYSLLNSQDNHTAVDILTANLYELSLDPRYRDYFMYLGSDSDAQMSMEQRYVYHFAEDQLKLPELTKYT